MKDNETLKYEVFGTPNTSRSGVQLEILEVLYKQRRRCSAGVREESLMKKLEDKIDNNKLRVHVDYLKEKGYITIKSVYDNFVTITITAKGIDLLENSLV